MQRKPDRMLGALSRSGARRLPCRFSSRRALRPQRIKIHHLSHPIQRAQFIACRHSSDFSRVAMPKPGISLGRIHYMRGCVTTTQNALSYCLGGLNRAANLLEFPGPRQVFPMLWPIRSKFDRNNPVFFVLCLTEGLIFDNRHGLRRKCKSGQAVQTLSAARPQL